MPQRIATNRSRTWMVGASVAGPRHRRTGARNQDAWQAVRRTHGTAIVVADGVGSARFAAESEILMDLSRQGVRIGAVPVATIYGTEQSKIHPLKDTVRFFKMLHRHRKARKS